jgi:hypothetical protein
MISRLNLLILDMYLRLTQPVGHGLDMLRFERDRGVR